MGKPGLVSGFPHLGALFRPEWSKIMRYRQGPRKIFWDFMEGAR
jgi:hypothetical protein